MPNFIITELPLGEEESERMLQKQLDLISEAEYDDLIATAVMTLSMSRACGDGCLACIHNAKLRSVTMRRIAEISDMDAESEQKKIAARNNN